ncbi:hypothetical protein FB451DRAFT_594398 [Mycena latifolia]|nr:hypothetical protein FB451DRAFT_594398 [Mycena latifolia]
MALSANPWWWTQIISHVWLVVPRVWALALLPVPRFSATRQDTCGGRGLRRGVRPRSWAVFVTVPSSRRVDLSCPGHLVAHRPRRHVYAQCSCCDVRCSRPAPATRAQAAGGACVFVVLPNRSPVPFAHRHVIEVSSGDASSPHRLGETHATPASAARAIHTHPAPLRSSARCFPCHGRRARRYLKPHHQSAWEAGTRRRSSRPHRMPTPSSPITTRMCSRPICIPMRPHCVPPLHPLGPPLRLCATILEAKLSMREKPLLPSGSYSSSSSRR